MKKFKENILPYLIVIIVVVVIRIFIITPVSVNGSSMQPHLNGNEIMLLNKLNKKINGINRYDIVVVKTSYKYLIKRVIGLPGEIIECKNNKIYINNKVIKDSHAYGITDDFDAVKIGKDEYFVLGDNREVSKDSRFIGPVKNKNILGTTNIVIYPLSKIRIVK